MTDAWLNLPRVAGAVKLLPLPEQEFALWTLACAARRVGPGLIVTIYGESGSGKSSLVRQTLRQSARGEKRKIACLAATQWPQFADEFPEPETLPPDKQKPDLVIIEDLPSLPEPRAAGDRLAAWIDQWRAEGMSVVITTNRLPGEIPDLSPRLRNRLQGGLFAGIRPLGADSMNHLWRQWSADLSLSALHVDRVPPNIVTAGQLKAWAASSPEPSAGIASPAPKTISLEMIAQAVADEYRVSFDVLQSGGRALQLRIPRCVAMSLARELTPLSLSTISRYFGCRSHTTVARSGTRLEQLVLDMPTLRQQLQSLRTKLRQELSADCG